MSIIRGRVWRFGDDIDTDVMMPGKALRAALPDARRMLFDAARPGFSDLVRPGDIIVGGMRFGTGSARPVAMHLRTLGVTAILAESMSSLFQRSTINAGLFAMTVPGIAAICNDGDTMEIDDAGGVVRVGERELQFAPLPEMARAVVTAGGIIEQLVAGGYLPAG
ncbi:MAG TPA: 3-isopropylmalate dehydratase [Ilumatobacteraceae bacterium]